MARESAGQAKNWAEVKVRLDRIIDDISKLPAPPVPRDSWSEKVNNLNRTAEGMNEQLRSELENEDAQLAAEDEE